MSLISFRNGVKLSCKNVDEYVSKQMKMKSAQNMQRFINKVS